jgi:hypothetical protein
LRKEVWWGEKGFSFDARVSRNPAGGRRLEMGEKARANSLVAMSIFVLTALGAAGSLGADPPGWTITLLTDDGKDPQVSGSNVVWEGSGPVHGQGLEIFFWDGANITQLTHISYNDAYPQISGSNVVWVGWIPGPGPLEREIFFWDGSTITELTTANDYDNFEPQLSGSDVVWQGWDGSDWEIFFWDGSMPPDPCQLTNNSYDDEYPQVSGSNVVWQGWDGSDYEIFFWDGTMPDPCQLTNNSYDDKNPQISGSNVVWHGPADGGDYEISLWDGTMPPNPLQLTNNSLADTDPQVSGSNVVWMGSDGNDMEIFLWDGTTPPDPCQLTDNTSSDTSPQISGSNVVWVSWTGGGYSEVVFWNGTATVLHGYDLSDCKPQISGSSVVWMVCWNGHSPVWLAFPDNDYDGVPDSEDNCPTERNPDQSDVDGDTVGDVCDECPADNTDECDPCKTGAASIPPGGGTVSTADGSVNVTVPASALSKETSISITGSGEGASFELTPSPGSGTSYDKVVLNPKGQHFGVPVTITLSWPDADSDGYIDGPNPGTNTNIKETNLQILKDGDSITNKCEHEETSCDRDANKFSVQVISLSEFALFELWQPAGPLGAWGWDIHEQTRVPADRYAGFSAGVWHSLAIKTDGSLVGWGRNDSNQVDVPDGNGFVAVAAGDGHSLALRTDGSIEGWGRDDYGQASPPDGNDYVAIGAGMIFSLALKADGSGSFGRLESRISAEVRRYFGGLG